mmetsp:Transcript_35591/g.66309  ORF Transcript_35591/g.66309 Transcript_35591/m.66309 type:complete len:230 (+) Transcript_35591:465-1154(+)
MRDSSFCQQHVHLPRHASSDGVNTELHVDVVRPKHICQLSHGCLRAGHSHAIARHYKDLLRPHEHLGRSSHGSLDVLLGTSVTTLGSRGAVVAAEEHVHDVAIHGVAHDLGEDGSAEADERANDRQHRAFQQEALGHQGPARIGVQHGDANRHVASTHASHQMNAHHTGERCNYPQQENAVGTFAAQEVVDKKDEQEEPGEVQVVFAWEIERLGRQVPVQLAEGDETSR